MIPIIITARKNSKRCNNKLLREFSPSGESLIEICLSKFIGRSDVFLAAYEEEFAVVARNYGINFIRRTQESAVSEDPLIIHNYLLPLKESVVCFLNPCCPMVRASTVDAVIKTYRDLRPKSLFSVKESHELIFDRNHNLVNTDNVFNSKIREPNFIGNNAIMVFDKNTLFSEGSYWDYSNNNPYLFVMDTNESLDIDTELDFSIARSVWSGR